MVTVTTDPKLIPPNQAAKQLLTRATDLKKSLKKRGLLNSNQHCAVLEFDEVRPCVHLLIDSSSDTFDVNQAVKSWLDGISQPLGSEIDVLPIPDVKGIAGYLTKSFTDRNKQSFPEYVKPGTRQFSASTGFGLRKRRVFRKGKVPKVRFKRADDSTTCTLAEVWKQTAKSQRALRKQNNFDQSKLVTVEVRERDGFGRVIASFPAEIDDDFAAFITGQGPDLVKYGVKPVFTADDSLFSIEQRKKSSPFWNERVLRAVFRWARNNPPFRTQN